MSGKGTSSSDLADQGRPLDKEKPGPRSIAFVSL